jgi:hypothetical protein
VEEEQAEEREAQERVRAAQDAGGLVVLRRCSSVRPERTRGGLKTSDDLAFSVRWRKHRDSMVNPRS